MAMLQETPPFGRWLKRLRTNLDLTQEALAEQVGCAGQTIRMFESGARRPSRDLAKRLAVHLDVPQAERDEFVRLARVKSNVETAPAAASSPPTPESTDTTAAARPPVPLRSHTALPVPPNILIGRSTEYAQIDKMLREPQRRLLTLVGPGGIGKTRLALQMAHDLANHFADGTVWVNLAPIVRSDDVPSTIADGLNLTLAGATPPSTQVLNALRERHMLVVLDNFEHVLGAVELVINILAQAPGVTLLVTSRERLHIAGEWVVELGGLALPDPAQATSVARAAAVLLFLERARQAQGSFALTSDNREAVAHICHLLDGIPLGIELAAAWTRMLTPAEIDGEIAGSLDFLALNDRTASNRHASMRAVFDHSWRLLTADERQVMARLAVFRGGFERQAAAEVVTAGVRVLAALLDKSLVITETGHAAELRYRLLEPVRQYAEVRLGESGEVAMVRERHAQWYLAWAKHAYTEMRTAAQVEWLARVSREHPNIQAAMTWFLEQGDLLAAAEMGWALWLFHWMRGQFTEGRRWMEQVLTMAGPAPSKERALALVTVCILAYGQGDYKQAETYVEESLTLYSSGIDDPERLADATAMAGLIAAGNGKEERAVPLMEEGHERYLSVGNKWGAALVLIYAAAIPLSHGDFAAATKLTERALPLARETGDRVGAYTALYNLALVAQSRNDWAEATRLFQQALTLSMEMGDEGNAAYCMEGLGQIAAAVGNIARAAQLWAGAEVLLKRGEAAVYAYVSDRTQHARMVAGARVHFDEEGWNTAWSRGQAMSTTELVDYALANN